MTDLAKAFRKIRAAWFEEVLVLWTLFEDECDSGEKIRLQNANTLLRARYDQQTDAILRGEPWPIAPRDAADMDREVQGDAG